MTAPIYPQSSHLAAVLVSFGVPAILLSSYLIGHWVGGRGRISPWMCGFNARGLRESNDGHRLPLSQAENLAPLNACSPTMRTAIYAEARHNAVAQFGDADEQHHVAIAAQLHADVRRLRGQVT